MNERPLLSVIVNFYNMRREAPRTLFSLSRTYQKKMCEHDYEVIAVDNGSSEPLTSEDVESFGTNFRYYHHHTQSSSPVDAINAASDLAKGRYITVCIDGARILSPGMLYYTKLATAVSANPVVAALSWHLGEKVQNESILEGYDQAAEDELLRHSGWKENGYRLFDISCLAVSCSGGWFRPFSESNCITVSRAAFDKLGGFETQFQTPGGGLANLDYFKRACDLEGSDLIVVLGEGLFHQFHGGVATNVPMKTHPRDIFKQEYKAIRGKPFKITPKSPIYIGSVTSNCTRFLADSSEQAFKNQ